MQDDAENPDLAYLQGLMDTSMPLVVAGWNKASKAEAPLRYDPDALAETIAQVFEVSRHARYADYSEVYLAPEGEFRLIVLQADQMNMIFEGLSPREVYRLMTTVLAAFPQEVQLYVVANDLSYAWLRTDLPEDEAIVHMLSHDDGVRTALGLPDYDHSQW